MKLISRLFTVILITLVGILPLSAQAEVILEVDLTVPNTITVTATTGASAATLSGSDTTGFYLEDFFAAVFNPISGSLTSGNLTSFLNTPDNTPLLFRSGGSDQGLNIWTYTDDPTSDIIAGTQAFSGSATWTISSGAYNDALNGSLGGDIYFPADDINDLPAATLLGQYTVTIPPPPAPIPSLSTWALILLTLMLAMVGFRSLRH